VNKTKKTESMSIAELLRKNRSYRRFDQYETVTSQQLQKWIGQARFCSSGRNMQPLKYVGSVNPGINSKIFNHLAWAGYLPEWNGPVEGERPAAYIIVVHDKSISDTLYCDDGIAVQSILLGAVEDGYGGCIIGTVNKAKVARLLNLPEHLEILWVLALGKPVEMVVIEDIKDNNVKYWRDENQVHHVPKRKAEELIYTIIP
jgi:nitroreductase